MREQTSGRWTAENRRNQRERGKRERRALGFRVDRFSQVTNAAFNIPDPPGYLEQQRATYIAEIESCARACEIPTDRAELFLKLLKLTSLGRTRVDVHAELDKLAPEPDLSKLTAGQLDKIRGGETLDVEPAAREGQEGSDQAKP